jgi:hypothetical protein
MVKWRKEGNYMRKKKWKKNPLYEQKKKGYKKTKKKKTKKKVKPKAAKTIKVTHATGTTNVLWDKRYKAMKPGKRISKNGNIYWEYRINRSDIKPSGKL